MDCSGSVNENNFGKMKTFVKDIASNLEINTGNSRVAALSFSKNIFEVIRFGENSNNLNTVLSKLGSAHFEGEKTNTVGALEKARDMLSEARPGVAKKLVILTDGKPCYSGIKTSCGCSCPSDDTNLREELRKLKGDMGVEIFAFGLGGELSGFEDDLRTWATSPKHYTRVEDYGTLPDFAEIIASAACAEPIATPCSNVDVAFLMDDSGSMTSTNYNTIKAFVKEFVKHNLNLLEGNSKVAAAKFSNNVYTLWNFNTAGDYNQFETALDSKPFSNGFTVTVDALKTARDTLFPAGRSGASKKLVVLTDGEPCYSADKYGSSSTCKGHCICPERKAELGRVIADLKGSVEIFVIGIGDKLAAYENDLKSWASSDNNYKKIASFDQLLDFLKDFGKMVC